MIYKTTKHNKGYTLLFAVLVSSIVLSVGISILTISKKEFLLSSSARESITAFYAADSGLECALYHNDYTSDFATTSASFVDFTAPCMGNNSIRATSTENLTVPTRPVYSFDFVVRMQNSSSSCAYVNVNKTYHADTIYGWLATTTITSKGYNLGWNETNKTCKDPSPRRVERAIEYTF